MPTTRPSRSNKGPPELPGFHATSVCMKGTAPTPRPASVTWRSRCRRWPNSRSRMGADRQHPLPDLQRIGSPRVTTGRSLASILITATSVRRSLPSTLAVNSRGPSVFTLTQWHFQPRAHCQNHAVLAYDEAGALPCTHTVARRLLRHSKATKKLRKRIVRVEIRNRGVVTVLCSLA